MYPLSISLVTCMCVCECVCVCMCVCYVGTPSTVQIFRQSFHQIGEHSKRVPQQPRPSFSFETPSSCHWDEQLHSPRVCSCGASAVLPLPCVCPTPTPTPTITPGLASPRLALCGALVFRSAWCLAVHEWCCSLVLSVAAPLAVSNNGLKLSAVREPP